MDLFYKKNAIYNALLAVKKVNATLVFKVWIEIMYYLCVNVNKGTMIMITLLRTATNVKSSVPNVITIKFVLSVKKG